MEARKIIITGGATRIGAAIAKKLSGPNKEILIHYNKSKIKAEILYNKINIFQKLLLWYMIIGLSMFFLIIMQIFKNKI